MLKNASILAIVAVHTAENEPPKGLKTGILQKSPMGTRAGNAWVKRRLRGGHRERPKTC